MSTALTRLLQLASPALPVGAYTYSQGLEWAVEAGTVRDEAGALVWIGDQLDSTLARFELPMLARFLDAWRAGGEDDVRTLDARYLASRESAELRAETLQMGHSLRRLLSDLRELPADFTAAANALPSPSFAALWSGLATVWAIPVEDALTAWAWSWAENQTMAALKTVPLGQAAGQRILLAVGTRLPAVIDEARALADDDFSNFAPGFAIACARHETQYSRLFRS
jgi:urease accessory protein